jgi:hypothetical protein
MSMNNPTGRMPDGTAQMAAPTAPPPGYYAPQSYEPAQGNGLHDAAQAARRYVRTPETKEFFRTSEFMIWLVLSVSMLIASAMQSNFSAHQAWSLVTTITVAYIVSRGIAKAGSRRAEPERTGDTWA